MSLLRLARKPPLTVPQDSSVMDAIRVMTDNRVGAVAVTGESGKVAGIFTERDVMKKVVLQGLDANATPLSSVMTKDIKTAAYNAKVGDAVDILRRNQIRHLLVLDENGHLHGIVSQRDLLYDVMDTLGKKADGLESYLSADGPGG